MKKHPNPWLDAYWQKPDKSKSLDKYFISGAVVVVLFVVGVFMSMPL